MRVAAFGEVMMRLMVTEKKTITQGNRMEYMFTGTGLNILGALIKMGHEGRLISKISHDSLGNAAMSAIMGLGIETRHIARGKGYSGMYFLEEGHGMRASKVTYSNRRESTFSRSQIGDYDIEGVLEGIDAIHMCGISLATCEELREVVYTLADRAKEKGIRVIFDFNYRPSIWEDTTDVKKHYERMLSYSDIVFATERDAKNLLGLTTDHDERQGEIEDLLVRVAKAYDLELVAGTIREGSGVGEQRLQGFVVDQKKAVFSREYKLHILDRIGGGDGYAAGIIHGVLEKYEPERLVEYATVSGVLAHTNYGDTPLSTREDIEEILRGEYRDLKR